MAAWDLTHEGSLGIRPPRKAGHSPEPIRRDWAKRWKETSGQSGTSERSRVLKPFVDSGRVWVRIKGWCALWLCGHGRGGPSRASPRLRAKHSALCQSFSPLHLPPALKFRKELGPLKLHNPKALKPQNPKTPKPQNPKNPIKTCSVCSERSSPHLCELCGTTRANQL